MGVQGLWDLLAPVGRRVSVETLAGKRLAIDASIWMIQFMKAMRDERGEMVRNAHLLGFFRRICKLLFLRTKPVFVFDGGTPALKRRTVIARRRQRENAQAKVRKTAEKLLLNQLKKMRLKELAKELEEQRMKNDAKGKKVASLEADRLETNDASAVGLNQEKIDEMLAASLAAEEHDMYNTTASTSTDALHVHDGGSSTSAGVISMEDVEDEDDEEMILPITNGTVDPTVLAALPPSVQLDLLVQMRERLMAENRQKYQKVKKAPQKFSELQIESYLKTVAFRREIDEVQKTAAGKGVGGLQTARIASEANKEFIFSSSFTGDKHVLASAGVRKNAENQDRAELENSLTPPYTLASAVASSSVPVPSGNEAPPSSRNEAPPSSRNEAGRDFGGDVQTYSDERGHMRVSRVRGMGIHMTRDLQRNLDMIKELEQDKMNAHVPVSIPFNPTGKDVGNIKVIFENSSEAIGEKSSNTERHDKDRPTADLETSLEISFEDDEQHKPLDNDDDFFSRLVAGDPVSISSVGDTGSKDQNLGSASDDEWEEGDIGVQAENVKSKAKTSQAEESIDNETELEWEVGISNIYEDASSCLAANLKPKSRGSVEEEAALQEAIRRSLKDIKGEANASYSIEKGSKVVHLMSEGPLHHNETEVAKNGSLDSSVSRTRLLEDMTKDKLSDTVESRDTMATPSVDYTSQNTDMVMDGPCDKFIPSDGGCLIEGGKSLSEDTAKIQSNAAVGTISNERLDVQSGSSRGTLNSHVKDVALADQLHLTFDETRQTDAGVPHRLDFSKATDIAVNLEESKKEPASNVDTTRMVVEEDPIDDVDDRQYVVGSKDDEVDNIQVVGASLEDELQILDEEYLYLGDEQRRLERNADSVNNEMFVECQELLQMFGLPYIIAPMEAEAQCAYMELAGLVEGVVTDDSDVILFGARSVYKNIFDDRKYVETYLMKDIESELGLTREKLIRMALLLGSDYTEGVSGIGIVNAIEVVNAFPEEDGLSKFRQWIESPDPTILGKLGTKPGSSSKKRGPRSSDTSMNVSKIGTDGISLSECDDNAKNEDNQELDNIPKITQTFMDKHRNVSKNWHIPSSFPSQTVISAYTCPQVDKSTDPCSWGKPDLFALRRLCWEKFGWASQKADEVLLPVLKEYNKHETQLRLEAFYTFNERFAKIRSKRIKQAVKGITGKQSFESGNDSKVGGKRNKRKNSTIEDIACGEESPADVSKEPRKTKAQKEKFPSQKEQASELLQEKETGSHGVATVSARGRKRAQAGGKRKRKGTPDVEFSDADSSNDDQEMQFQKQEAPDSLRRSTRSRKAAKYAESEEEVDETARSLYEATDEEKFRDQSFDKDDSICFGELGQCTAGDLVPDDGLRGDYLLKDGGFCADEDEPEKEIGPLQGDNAPVEVDGCYLHTGGGFCADEDEPEKEIGPLQEDSAPVDVDGCHLQTGGGFFADEDELEKETGPSQDDVAPTEVGGCYLQSGGGFCLDDHDSDHDSQKCASEETKGTQWETEDKAGKMCSSTPSEGALDMVLGTLSSNSSGLQQHSQSLADTTSGNPSKSGKAMPEVKDDTDSPIKALSAMPYLRRKKRK